MVRACDRGRVPRTARVFGDGDVVRRCEGLPMMAWLLPSSMIQEFRREDEVWFPREDMNEERGESDDNGARNHEHVPGDARAGA